MDRSLPARPACILQADAGIVAPALIHKIDAPVRHSTPYEAWNRIDDAAELVVHPRPLVRVAVPAGCTSYTAKSILLWYRSGPDRYDGAIAAPARLSGHLNRVAPS